MPNGEFVTYDFPAMSLEDYLGWLWMYLYEVGGVAQATATDAVKAERKRIEEQGERLQAGSYYQAVMSYIQSKQPEAEPTIPQLSEEQIGGYLYLVPRDEQGNIIANSPYFKTLGPVEATGLSAWQQSQVNQWQQEFEAQQQQARMQQQQAMMPYGQMTAYQQAQMDLQRKAQWAETMAMPPSGWIEQFYRMQGGQVGYKPESKSKGMTEKEYATRFRETIPVAREAIEGWERGQGLPRIEEMPLRGNWIYVDETTPTRGLITHTITEPGIRPEYVAPATGLPSIATGMWTTPSGVVAPKEEFSRLSEIGYQMVAPPKPPTGKKPAYGLMKPVQRAAPTPTPRTPPAPPGLSQFVPSQVTGQPISRAPTTTPSGQMWAQTPWSQQEMLRGYTGWAGYRPYEDIMQHMWAMQPATPAGAGRQRWQPARQWA